MRNNNGFTLIETLIYISIIGGVIMSFTSFSLSISSLRNKNFSSQETITNSRIAMGVISDYIKQAESVISPAKGETSTFLLLDMPESIDDIRFELNDGTIYLKEGSETPQALVSNYVSVNTLNFSNYGGDFSNDIIKVSLNANYRYNSSIDFQYEQNLETSVSLRN
ncbi:hypothetical protein C0583_04945 [Candidatus Parcubacteria bacterium]|nr:MAG: hypothetical protein C0583_04945 [Candidatus Parcubacteria bacterium]